MKNVNAKKMFAIAKRATIAMIATAVFQKLNVAVRHNVNAPIHARPKITHINVSMDVTNALVRIFSVCHTHDVPVIVRMDVNVRHHFGTMKKLVYVLTVNCVQNQLDKMFFNHFQLRFLINPQEFQFFILLFSRLMTSLLTEPKEWNRMSVADTIPAVQWNWFS